MIKSNGRMTIWSFWSFPLKLFGLRPKKLKMAKNDPVVCKLFSKSSHTTGLNDHFSHFYDQKWSKANKNDHLPPSGKVLTEPINLWVIFGQNHLNRQIDSTDLAILSRLSTNQCQLDTKNVAWQGPYHFKNDEGTPVFFPKSVHVSTIEPKMIPFLSF